MMSSSTTDTSGMLFVESDVLTETEKRNGVMAFDHDFILMAEFCEQRGPVPIMVWPPEKGAQRFDLNKFVVRILASDHTRRFDPRGINSGWQNPDDTQIYLTDDSQGAHCYVHHLTLHDLHARGYVRPICLCYITVEPDKVLNFFPELLSVFTKVSQTLKYGNNLLFVSDVDEQLNSLLQHIDESEVEQHAKFNALAEFPELTGDVLDAILQDLKSFQTQFLSHLYESDHQFDKRLIDEPSGETHKRHSRRIPKPNDTILTEQPQSQIDFPTLFEKGLSISSHNLKKFMPMVLKCIHKSTNFEELLRSIPDVCSRTFETASDIIDDILEHFSRPTFVLDLEKDDLAIMTAGDTPSQLYIGKNLVMNFNMEREPYSQAVNRDSWKYRPSYLSKTHPHTLSITSFSSISSSNGSYYRDPLDEYETNNHSSSNNNNNNEECLSTPGRYYYHSPANEPSPLPPQRVSNLKLNTMYKNGFNGSFISSVFDDDINTFAVSMSPRAKLPGRGILLSREYYSYIKEIVYSLLTGRLLIVHARPEHEQYVRNLVTTFSMFVPGQAFLSENLIIADSICSWRTKPLTIQDIATLKLCGLSKRVVISRTLEPYVSKLDLEESVLYAPQYHGEYLDRIFTQKKAWPDEETFVSYIHTVLLQLSTKAALYHHLHSIANASATLTSQATPISAATEATATTTTTTTTTTEDVKSASFSSPDTLSSPKSYADHYMALKKERHRSLSNPPLAIKLDHGTKEGPVMDRGAPAITPRHILSKLGVRRSDVDIVEYLSELIKNQQAQALLHQLPPSIVLHPLR